MLVKPFKDNDRVVFFGDSITHNNHYIMYIYSYYREHFPNLNIRFYNSGIAGASLPTGFRFYDEDLKAWNPNVVVMMYGMNDSQRYYLDVKNKKVREKGINTAFEEYKVNLDKMYHKLINDGFRVILCTPTPYDETNESEVPFLKGGENLIKKYADYVREYATNNNIELIDYHPYITELVKTRKGIMKEDHVHPTLEAGHIEMARFFLAQQGFDLDIDSLEPDYLELDRLIQLLRDTCAADFLLIPEEYSKEQKMDYIVKQTFDDEYLTFLANRYVSVNGDTENIRKQIESQMNKIDGLK